MISNSEHFLMFFIIMLPMRCIIRTGLGFNFGISMVSNVCKGLFSSYVFSRHFFQNVLLL